MKRIDEIMKRAESATRGPWLVGPDGKVRAGDDYVAQAFAFVGGDKGSVGNVTVVIAHAWLLNQREQLLEAAKKLMITGNETP